MIEEIAGLGKRKIKRKFLRCKRVLKAIKRILTRPVRENILCKEHGICKKHKSTNKPGIFGIRVAGKD